MKFRLIKIDFKIKEKQYHSTHAKEHKQIGKIRLHLHRTI